jgi:alpha-D-ribose 1-methylphosphonate 5-triphosphate synthase subunit PhnH
MQLFRLDPLGQIAQQCFRSLLEALSRPGILIRLAFPEVPDCFPRSLPLAMAAVGYTLLDEQVSVAACGSDADGWVDELRGMTSARRVPLSEADYVVSRSIPALGDMQDMKKGTLLDPECSATLVVWFDDDLPGTAGTLKVSGPGIEVSHAVAANAKLLHLVANLRSARAEYPMGLDTLVIDAGGRLLGLPRTAVLELEA